MYAPKGERHEQGAGEHFLLDEQVAEPTPNAATRAGCARQWIENRDYRLRVAQHRGHSRSWRHWIARRDELAALRKRIEEAH